jgi:hypothetical protein
MDLLLAIALNSASQENLCVLIPKIREGQVEMITQAELNLRSSCKIITIKDHPKLTLSLTKENCYASQDNLGLFKLCRNQVDGKWYFLDFSEKIRNPSNFAVPLY